MRTIGNHIQAAILRAVTSLAGTSATDREKAMMLIAEIRSADWASATFVGATHAIDLRFEGPAAAVAAAVDRLVAGLADCEIPIAGHIVAEIAVEQGAGWSISNHVISKCLTVNALTIVD